MSWRGLSLTGINFVLLHADTIYIDILSFVDRMSFQSGDKIVPPLKRTPKCTSSTVVAME